MTVLDVARDLAAVVEFTLDYSYVINPTSVPSIYTPLRRHADETKASLKIATVLELMEPFAELTYLTTFNEQLHANELLSAEA